MPPKIINAPMIPAINPGRINISKINRTIPASISKMIVNKVPIFGDKHSKKAVAKKQQPLLKNTNIFYADFC